ncbi:hypothetical protein E1A91_D11G237200v1 [Gossypium mustelinum]|uniref:Uncharacterized protein n=1 Tax=Gossypium mustelinum TaxID=34275 RepID=A0A5D2SWL8_GOSMU|nr:hypothetical protein E1A91_D11G237200v1 [Gossypium mustelinum]
MDFCGLFNHFQLLALPIFYNLCPFSVIKVHRKLEEDDTDISQTKSMLADGPWTNSSTSVIDLYPVNLTSGYWQNTDSTK